VRIFKNGWFKRFAKKEKLSPTLLKKAIDQAEKGLIDADLGHGVLKLRLARANEGKSVGYRTIVLYLQGERAFFVYGFAKSKRANIRDDEKQAFRAMADEVLNLSDAQIDTLIGKQLFFEVTSDE